MRRTVLGTAAALLLIGLLILLANGADSAAGIITDRLRLCSETLIPSLFGCTVTANLIRESGAGAWLGMRLRLFGRLLGVDAQIMGIFLVSQISGYPVGAMLLRSAVQSEQLNPDTARRLSLAAYGGGPAFLVGLAGVQLFGSAAAGWVMLGSCAAANCIALRLLRIRESPHPAVRSVPRLTSDMLPKAVSDAAAALIQICGIVLAFGLAAWLCGRLGITAMLVRLGVRCGMTAQTARALLAALLDVTQLTGMFVCGLPFSVLLPLTAGLLSFGGICAQVQCAALGVKGLRLSHLTAVRALTACLAALLTALCVPLLPLPLSVPAMAQGAAVSRAGSVLPGILILLTGFPVLLCRQTNLQPEL